MSGEDVRLVPTKETLFMLTMPVEVMEMEQQMRQGAGAVQVNSICETEVVPSSVKAAELLPVVSAPAGVERRGGEAVRIL